MKTRCLRKKLPFRARLLCALNGICSAVKTESSLRIQVACTLVLISFLVIVGASAVWWAIFLTIVGCVLAAEVFNTSLEHIADLLHPDENSGIQIAKDCAAGAVLILSFVSLLVFFCFLIDRFRLGG